MRDWLTIQFEKGSDSHLTEFIQANPVLDKTMRTLLVKQLNLSESNLEKWIEKFQHGPSKYMYLHLYNDHPDSGRWSKMATSINILLLCYTSTDLY